MYLIHGDPVVVVHLLKAVFGGRVRHGKAFVFGEEIGPRNKNDLAIRAGPGRRTTVGVEIGRALHLVHHEHLLMQLPVETDLVPHLLALLAREGAEGLEPV